eukprot:s1188_g28.t1
MEIGARAQPWSHHGQIRLRWQLVAEVILLPWTWYLTRCLLFPRPPPELDFETGGLKSEDCNRRPLFSATNHESKSGAWDLVASDGHSSSHLSCETGSDAQLVPVTLVMLAFPTLLHIANVANQREAEREREKPQAKQRERESGQLHTLSLLLREAENLLTELEVLQFVHPADVVALDEGAVETPPQRGGTVAERARAVLRDLGGIVPFLAADGEPLRMMLGKVTAALNDPIAVDTQTTDGGDSSSGRLFGQPRPEEEDAEHPAGDEDREVANSGGCQQPEGSQAATDSRVKLCGTSLMQARRHNAQQIAKRRRFRGIIKVQLVGAAIGWAFLFWVLWELKGAPTELRTFDPYDILGVQRGAELREIKKAYHTKSLQHHPDKERRERWRQRQSLSAGSLPAGLKGLCSPDR